VGNLWHERSDREETEMSEQTADQDRLEADAATGAVGNTPMEPWPTSGASNEGQPPNADEHNPGLPQHTTEDRGWVPEEQGSALAHEREGVPEDDVPDNLSESAARQRRKA
jgi:hypothetical protein